MHRFLAATVALAACSSLNAAPLTTTQSAGTGVFSLSVSDTTSGASAVIQSLSSQPLAFGQFDASLGVLTGVSSAITFNAGSLSLTAFGTQATGGGNPSFGSTGSVSVSSSLPSGLVFGSINDVLTNTCSGNGAVACFGGNVANLSANTTLNKTDSSWVSATAASQTNLDNYVGSASIASNLTIISSVSLTGANKITGPTATLALTGVSGTQSLTYSYLRHANASFSSGSDVNALTLGSGLTFSVYNLGDASTAKLDFLSLQCVSGNCDAFSVTMPNFQDLAAGTAIAGNAVLTAAAPGNYAAQFSLVLSDDTAFGASGSHLQNTLTLDLNGSVPAVPEPSTWALLSLGLIGLALRKRKA
jgi:hypothetical protein